MDPFILHPESLTKILQMAGTQVETLEYLQSALQEKTKTSGTEYSEVMNEITKLVDYAVSQEQKLNKLNSWSGARDMVDKLRAVFETNEFSTFQDFMAAKLASKVPVEQITLDCEISDQAEFLRAYSINGEVLEGDALEAMDILFNSWLAQPETKMIMNNGVIYSGTDKGEIARDTDASVVKARAERVKELLSDPVLGFESYVQKKKPGAQVQVIRHEVAREEQAPS